MFLELVFIFISIYLMYFELWRRKNIRKSFAVTKQINIQINPQIQQKLIQQNNVKKEIKEKQPIKKKRKKKSRKIENNKEIQIIEEQLGPIQQQPQSNLIQSQRQQHSITKKKSKECSEKLIVYEPTLQDIYTYEFILEQLNLIKNYFLRQMKQVIPHSQKIMGTYQLDIYDPFENQKSRKQVLIHWKYSLKYPLEPPHIIIKEVSNFSRVYEEQIRQKITKATSEIRPKQQFVVYQLFVSIFQMILELNNDDEIQPQIEPQIKQINQESKNIAQNLNEAHVDIVKNPGLQEMMNQIFYGHDLLQPPLFLDHDTTELRKKIINQEKSRYRKQFQETKKIGQGGYGRVYLAKNIFDKNTYAIKKIILNYCDSNSKKTVKQVQLLSQLNHPNIVRYHQSWIQQPRTLEQIFYQLQMQQDDQERNQLKSQLEEWNKKKKQNQSIVFQNYSQEEEYSQFDAIQEFSNNIPQDQSQISFQQSQNNDEMISPFQSFHNHSKNKEFPFKIMYIAMQYCGGTNLKDYINSMKTIKDEKKIDEQRIKIIRGILEALVYIHHKKIIHRDLKPANIFLDEKNQKIKLGDFGLATSHGQEKQIKHSQGVGTPYYTAPQQLKSQKYDEKVDIYSLGIILFELYYRFNTNMERISVLTQLTKNKKFPTDFEKFCKSSQQKQLIKILISDKPNQRPSSQSLLLSIRNKYFSQIVSSITNPNHFEFQQLLNHIFKIKNIDSKTFIRDSFKNYDYMKNQKIFKSHGGINIHINPFIPIQDHIILNKKKINSNRDEKFLTLSQEGVILQFARNAYLPWIRWIKEILSKKSKKRFSCVKRYSFGEILFIQNDELKKMFKEKTIGIFDMVYIINYQTKIMEYQCQMIKMSIELNCNKETEQSIQISHSGLMNVICEELKLNQNLIYEIILSKNFKKVKNIEELRKYDIEITLCRKIISYLEIQEMDLDTFIQTIQSLIITKRKLLQPIFEHFRELNRILTLMKVQKILWKVEIPPQNTNGIFWKIGIVNAFASIQSIQQNHKNQELGNIHIQFELLNINKREIDVYIWSIGQYIEKQIIEIVVQCWNAGIHAQWSKQPKGQKVQGIKVGVILKRIKPNIFVTIKNFSKNTIVFDGPKESMNIVEKVKNILKNE